MKHADCLHGLESLELVWDLVLELKTALFCQFLSFLKENSGATRLKKGGKLAKKSRFEPSDQIPNKLLWLMKKMMGQNWRHHDWQRFKGQLKRIKKGKRNGELRIENWGNAIPTFSTLNSPFSIPQV